MFVRVVLPLVDLGKLRNFFQVRGEVGVSGGCHLVNVGLSSVAGCYVGVAGGFKFPLLAHF